MKNDIKTLDEFLQSSYYEMCESDYFLNIQYYYENDPDRAERMEKGSVDGNFGLTHRERIEDMNEALDLALQDDYITSEIGLQLQKEIDELHDWHKQNGTIDDET